MDDVTALVTGKNKDVAEMARKVMNKLKRGSREKGPQTVGHREWKGRKE